ncbi:MAG: hypothetical protein Q7S40_08110 [Opitutaceae bacterium]|nr:hypothetical protein [Opitutaceae bacterium]
MRFISLLFSALCALAISGPVAHAADGVSVRAILIIASNAKGASDPKLAPYEATLRRNLPFESFRYAGEGSASVSAGGQAKLSLGRGHRLELDSEKGGGRGIRVKVRWTDDGRELMTTALVLQPGVPAVLGRRGDQAEVPVVLMIAN